MPYVKIEIFKGRAIEQKRLLISEMTRVISETLECPSSSVWIVIDEKDPGNWGLDGVLASDGKP